MEGNHLNFTNQRVLFQHPIDHIEKVVEDQKIGKQTRVNQERGLHLRGGRVPQIHELRIQGVQEAIEVLGIAHDHTDLVFDVGRFRKRAEVQADHGLLQPLARLRQHLILTRCAHFKAL